MNLYPEFQINFNSNFKYHLMKKNKKICIFSKNVNSKSIELPNFIIIKQIKNILFFKSIIKNITLKFLNFQKNIKHMLKFLNKNFKRYLVLKGLGMRIRYLKSIHILILKLGFSNLINITVPISLKILRNKNVLIIEGNDAVLIGNFTNLIRNLKKPDSYKGKGFWYKNEIKILKPVKKL